MEEVKIIGAYENRKHPTEDKPYIGINANTTSRKRKRSFGERVER